MASELQLRRGSHAEVAAFTGAVGEPIYDQTQKRITVQDGVTVGGIPLARLDEVAVGSGIQVSALGGVAPVGAIPGILLVIDSDTNAVYAWDAVGGVWLMIIAPP